MPSNKKYSLARTRGELEKMHEARISYLKEQITLMNDIFAQR